MTEGFEYAFPRHKPQFFARSIRSLAAATRYYAFGRRRHPLLRRGLYHVVGTPLLNRIAVRSKPFDIPCPDGVWATFQDQILRSDGVDSLVIYQSQWRRHRFAVMGISSDGEVLVYARIRTSDETYTTPSRGPWAFRVPDLIADYELAAWWMGLFQPLPALHTAAPWDPDLLRRVAADVSAALAGRLPRHQPPSPGWVPIHGDLTPWNLRIDGESHLWLIDWEQATWAPKQADILRYVLAYGAIQGDDHLALLDRVSAVMSIEDDTAAAAAFWLEHESYNLTDHRDWERPELDRGKIADWTRAGEEVVALRSLAGAR